MKFVISAGHGKYIRGAADIIDEVDEARKVVPAVAKYLRQNGHEVVEVYDDVSTTQDANLHWLVDQHNSQTRDLDISVHFNAYTHTKGAMGTECLYVSQENIAQRVANAIAAAGGLINRGPKKRTDLYFLNKTDEPAILIETCFVDSEADVQAYEANFDAICQAIANVAPVGNKPIEKNPVLQAKGKVSWFGGPEDMGVSPSEGLAFIYEYSAAPYLFLKQQPPNTTGLARRLNTEAVPYIAMRWDYDVYPKAMLASGKYRALVHAPKTGKSIAGVFPADWGPHSDTSRVADCSNFVLAQLGIVTDDEVEVVFPAPVPKEPKATKAKPKARRQARRKK